MMDFAYARAGTAESAVRRAGRRPGTSLIAGGTELLNWFRLGIAAADRVVDIGGLDELRGIARDGDDLRIGALATLNEIGEHPLVVAHGRRAGLGVPAGRLGPDTQPGHARRERAAAHPLRRTSAPRSRCPGRATSALPAAAAPRWRACTSGTPSSAGPRTAWPCSRPTRRSRWPCWTPQADVARPGRAADDPDDRSSTSPSARKAGSRCGRHRLEPDELIVGYRLPVERPTARPTSRSASGRPTSTRSCPPPPPCGSTGAARVALARWRASPGGCPTWSACRSPGRRCCPPSRGAWPTPPRCRSNGFKVTMARNAAVRALLTAGGARMTAARGSRPPPSSPAPRAFAADHRPDGVLHAVLVGAPVAAGHPARRRRRRGPRPARRHGRAHRRRPARLPPPRRCPRPC